MSQETNVSPSPKQLEKAASSWPTRLGIFLLILLIGWFYWWTALPDVRGPRLEKEGVQYYNLLCRGLMKGHLYLDSKVDPYLLTAPDPWDPVARAGRGPHDATYYNHHYYLYFGISPELLLFWPFRALTGTFITESVASVVFCFAGFLFSVWLILEIRKRFFHNAPGWLTVALVLPLGLATMVPALLRRPSFWEVPIACAYMCAMAALLCLAKALNSSHRKVWIAAASLALGLAVGARPVYVLSCAILLLPLLYWRNEFGGLSEAWKKRNWWMLLGAALLPALFCGIGLAWYNYARFGSITEFGQRYQLAGDEVSKLTLFSWRNPPYAFLVYMLEPASFTAYFPFFTVINPPPAPPHHMGVEDPYGVLPNLPFVLFGFALLGMLRRGDARWRMVTVMVTCILGLAALTGIVVMSFGGITNRYMVDFTPALVVVGAIGALFLFSLSGLRGICRAMAVFVFVVLTLYSIAFGVCVSIGHNNQMRAEQPAEYDRIAHAGNTLSYAWDRLIGQKYGPIEMKVVFPQGKEGQLEPLIVTGTNFWSDYLYVLYQSPTTASFGFEHTSHGSIVGKPFHVKPGEVQTIRIDMGSIYPPAAHPYFDQFDPIQAHLLQKLLKVTVDGETSLEALTEFYDSSSRSPSVGNSGGRVAFTRPFSGRIISWRRLPDSLPKPPPEQFGPVKLFLKFPAFVSEKSEPLVCSGVTGAGDLIFVHYLNDHQLYFGHDNWGSGAQLGSPVSVDYKADHVLEIDYAALYPPKSALAEKVGARTIVLLDGKIVFDKSSPAHPSSAYDVQFVNNAIGASSSYPTFTGVLTRTERLPHPLTE